MSDSDNSSVISDTEDSGSEAGQSTAQSSGGIKDLLYDEPMFHVLGQFLVAGSKNIADVLLELVAEVAKLRAAVTALQTPR